MEIHVVQQGETLYAIAGRYGVDPELLRLVNGVGPGGALAVGNAPTALLRLCELMEGGLRPAFVVAVPVGFVNVVESKERALAACERYGVPCIAALGRKGGSNVAAAICNALLYAALDATDPGRRQETLS